MLIRNRSILKTNQDENEDTPNDQVPFGVVNSMRQRFLQKINESLPNYRSGYGKQRSRSNNFNQNKNRSQQKSPSKYSSHLSQSHEHLYTQQNDLLNGYLKPKLDVIIVEQKTDDQQGPTSRRSHNEVKSEEVPRPGTVITVKNMFERQIRMGRADTDQHYPMKHSNTHHSQWNAVRSRSISPNDMAIRQRRATMTISTNSASTVSKSIVNPIPDVIISHTPSPVASVPLNSHRPLPVRRTSSLLDMRFNTPNDGNHQTGNLSSTPSDTTDNETSDLKKRLAVFNQVNGFESNGKNSSLSNDSSSNSGSVQAESTSKNFPVEELKFNAQTNITTLLRTTMLSEKPVTYYGGTKFDENLKSFLLPSSPIRLISVKKRKSSIHSGIKKPERVKFTERVDTFEYLSYEAAVEASGENENDDDQIGNPYQNYDESPYDNDEEEFERLARTNTEWNMKNLSDKPVENKGSLHTYRPTYFESYKIEEYDLNPSDNSTSTSKRSLSSSAFNYSLYKQGTSPFDFPTPVNWSSISSNPDLLF